MNFIATVCSYLCGQERCFVVDGTAMPICQRCLGLYVGAALTAMWLILSGTWRRGLPDRQLLILHTAILLATILGGVHVIDLGPVWRVLCGMWTGHIVMLWLTGGTLILWRTSKEPRQNKLHDYVARRPRMSRFLTMNGLLYFCPAPKEAQVVGLSWSESQRIQCMVAVAALTILAHAIPLLHQFDRNIWLILTAMGMGSLLLVISAAGIGMTVWALTVFCLRGSRFVDHR